MKKITILTLLFLAFLCSTKTLQAQITPNNVIWAKKYGGVNLDAPNDMVTDKDGNIYITGEYQYETNFEDITLTAANGFIRTFITKTNPSGTLLFAKQFGGTGTDGNTKITADNEGNVYITGIFSGEITFGSTTFNAGINLDVFVTKQDALGNVLWATRFSGLQGAGIILSESIVTDHQDNVYTTGNFYGVDINVGNSTLTPFGTESNIFVIKQDALGNVMWAKNFGGDDGSVLVSKIISDDFGNTYLIGTFLGSVNFGNTTLINSKPSGRNIFLTKLDTSGAVLWAKDLGENDPGGFVETLDIALDKNDNIYFTGRFSGKIDIGTSTFNSSSINSVVVKTDNSGEFLWVKKLESNSPIIGLGITVDASNNVYVAGRFSSMAWFDDIYLDTNTNSVDAFVLKINSLAMVEWVGKFEGNGSAVASNITVDAAGDILVVGDFINTKNFGDTTLTSVSNSDDIFLVKLSPDGLAIDKNQNVNYWSVYPNPTNNFINLDFSDGIENISVEMFNMLGQRVKVFENKNNFKNLDLSEFTSGIYLLKIIKDNETFQTIKIKKQ